MDANVLFASMEGALDDTISSERMLVRSGWTKEVPYNGKDLAATAIDAMLAQVKYQLWHDRKVSIPQFGEFTAWGQAAIDFKAYQGLLSLVENGRVQPMSEAMRHRLEAVQDQNCLTNNDLVELVGDVLQEDLKQGREDAHKLAEEALEAITVLLTNFLSMGKQASIEGLGRFYLQERSVKYDADKELVRIVAAPSPRPKARHELRLVSVEPRVAKEVVAIDEVFDAMESCINEEVPEEQKPTLRGAVKGWRRAVGEVMRFWRRPSG